MFSPSNINSIHSSSAQAYMKTGSCIDQRKFHQSRIYVYNIHTTASFCHAVYLSPYSNLLSLSSKKHFRNCSFHLWHHGPTLRKSGLDLSYTIYHRALNRALLICQLGLLALSAKLGYSFCRKTPFLRKLRLDFESVVACIEGNICKSIFWILLNVRQYAC